MLTMQEGSVYVREKRATGATDPQIAAMLAADGWQHDDIAKVLSSAEVSAGAVASAAPAPSMDPVLEPVMNQAPDPIVPITPITPIAPVTPVAPIMSAAPAAPPAPITLADADEVPDVGLPDSPLRTAPMLVTPHPDMNNGSSSSDKHGHPLLRMIGWILVTFIIGGLFGGAEYFAYKNNLLGVLKPYVAQYLPFLPKSL